MAKQQTSSTTGLDLYYKSLNGGKTPLKEIKHKAAAEIAGVPTDLLKKQNPGMFHQLLDILDRPGNATRALMVGKLGGLKGLIPFGQTIEDLTGLNVGIDETDRVAGTEVVDKLFGKQVNKAGELDVSDVLGFIVEVAADPLWLVGAGAVTATGKAAKVAGSALKGAEATLAGGKATTEAIASAQKIKAAIDAARQGTAIPRDLTPSFIKTLETWQKSGAKPFARTMGEQAEAGHRALLTFANKPLIKGKTVLEGLDKIGDAYKLSALGHAIRPVGSRTESKYSDVYEMMVDAVERANKEGRSQTEVIEGIAKQFPDIDKQKLSEYIEAAGAEESGQKILGRQLKKGTGDPDATFDKMDKMLAEKAKIESSIDPVILPKFKQAAGQTIDLNKRNLEFMQKAGVPIGNVDKVIGYLSRNLSDEALDFYLKNSPTVPNFGAQLKKAFSTATKERGELGGMTRPEVEAIFAKHGYKGKSPVFEPNLFKTTARHIGKSAKVAGHAEGVQAVLSKYAKPIPEDGTVPMDYWKIGDIDGNKENVYGVFGIDQYKDMMIPRSISRELTDASSNASSEELMHKFWKGVDTGTSWWKGAMTVYWPAYHARNVASNINLQALHRDDASWLNPASYFKTTAKLPTGEVLTKEQLKQMATDDGLLKQSLGELGRDEIKGKFFEPGRKVTSAIEDRPLLAEYARMLEQGFSREDAARTVKESMINYGGLSPFEKTWARRAVPFYSFSRKNLPIQSKALFQQPGKQAVIAHATTGTPEMGEQQESYPNWWRERLVAKLPWQTNEGKDLVIAGTGLPIEDAFGNFAGASNEGLWGTVQRLATRQLARSSPLIKTPIEFASGKDLYYGKDIDATPYAPKWARLLPEKAASAVGIEKIKGQEGKQDRYIMNPKVSWAMRQTPFINRASTSAEMIADTGEPTATNITGFVTGFKPRTYDKERQQKLALAEITKQELEREAARGRVYKFNKYYKPKGLDIDDDKAKEIEMLLKAQ